MPVTKPRPASFRVELAAGRTVTSDPDHIHDRPHGMDGWILNCTVEGRGRVNRGSRQFHVAPGQLLLFQPLAPHDYGCASDCPAWNHLWVYFFPRPTWYDWLNWSAAAPGILRLDLTGHPLLPRVIELLEEILRLVHGAQPRRVALATSVLEQLLLWCDAANPLAGHVRLDPRIQRAVDLLCERANQRVTIAMLARACELSPSRLSHLFQAQLGTSPLAWLEQHRIALAKEQLLLSGRPIAEVAQGVGFSDAGWFTRVFRRRVGVSPRAFRRAGR